MKKILLILIFTASALKSQILAPEIRCLEVTPNGNVKLTWIPPADPNNLFFSYEIFSSNNLSGPYALIGTIGALASTGFVHNGNANGTSLYYFMRTVYGSSGSNNSGNSDTLRSIFLNIIPGSLDLKLVYNQLKQPKLPSSSSIFTILKEPSPGIWTILGTSPNLTYNDTVNVCRDSLAYQITLADNSGCISSSNIQSGVYTDQKPPNEPFVDSISVKPNGQTVLAWRVPRDLDIEKYYILKKAANGTNQYIDSVLGRLSTVYTYTPADALNEAIQLFVAAVDSCNNISTFDNQPITMNLKCYYDVCAYQTTLSWNAYQNLYRGVKEYRIYYSVNGGAFNFIGTSTVTSFIHYTAEPGKTLCYYVRVVNNDGSITASSNRSCFYSNQVKAPAFVYLQNANVITQSSIEVEIYIDSTVTFKGIECYRSSDGIKYELAAYLPSVNSAHYSFIDENLQCSESSYFYKAVVRDSCDNQRNKSNVSKTMLLNVRADEIDFYTQHLSWSPYEGYAGGLSGYNIYRIINNVPNSIPIGFTDAQTTTFTDRVEEVASVGAQIEYKIEAFESITNPYGIKEKSNSNRVPIYIEGRLFVPNAFAPDGKNKTWLPITYFIDVNDYHVMVFDRWGKIVFETNSHTEAWDGSGKASDVFVYLITYKNSRGEPLEARGSVLLLR